MGIVRIYWDYYFSSMDKLVEKVFEAEIF